MEPIVFRPLYLRSGCIFVACIPFLVFGVYGAIAGSFLSVPFILMGGLCLVAPVVQAFTRIVVDDFGVSKYRFGRLGSCVAWEEIASWDIREVGMDDEGDSFIHRIIRINIRGRNRPMRITNCEACRPPLETLADLIRAKMSDQEKTPEE